jgi:antitoxin component YwqK of YwqJK toxin-antitoxin module
VSYNGEFKDGKRDGQGISFHPDGAIDYEGTWSNNYVHGNGKRYYKNGNP